MDWVLVVVIKEESQVENETKKGVIASFEEKLNRDLMNDLDLIQNHGVVFKGK